MLPTDGGSRQQLALAQKPRKPRGPSTRLDVLKVRRGGVEVLSVEWSGDVELDVLQVRRGGVEVSDQKEIEDPVFHYSMLLLIVLLLLLLL